MKKTGLLIAIVAVAILAVAGFVYSGLYDVSASSPHNSVERWFLSTMSHASIERRARDIDVPDLSDDQLVLAGINDFNSMCAGCHGAPGRNPEAMGLGLNPPAPDLSLAAVEMTPAEMFWVTKHGIKMTGMPSWGVTHDDGSIWPVVAFMTKLPDLNEASYQEMLNSAVGHGHHAEGAAGDDHSHGEGGETAGGNVHVHDDGTAHVHEAPAEADSTGDHSDSEHEHENP